MVVAHNSCWGLKLSGVGYRRKLHAKRLSKVSMSYDKVRFEMIVKNPVQI